ncbi:hypothetical protein [Azospirillum griseum]|nr:hypothetical protein [Azospirillum griseum]
MMDGGSGGWRADIDALVFQPPNHQGWCAVHRLAFRTLLGWSGRPADCVAFFAARRPAFDRAAVAKIVRCGLRPTMNLHLTSRDVARALESPVATP